MFSRLKFFPQSDRARFNAAFWLWEQSTFDLGQGYESDDRNFIGTCNICNICCVDEC